MDPRLETALFGVVLTDRESGTTLVICANPRVPVRATWADLVRCTSGTDPAAAETTEPRLSAYWRDLLPEHDRFTLGNAYARKLKEDKLDVTTYGLPADVDKTTERAIGQAIGSAFDLVQKLLLSEKKETAHS